MFEDILLKEEAISYVLPDIVLVSIPFSTDTALSVTNSLVNNTTIDTIYNANRPIRAIDSTVNLKMNGISFELDSSTSEDFLSTFIKAVRHV